MSQIIKIERHFGRTESRAVQIVPIGPDGDPVFPQPRRARPRRHWRLFRPFRGVRVVEIPPAERARAVAGTEELA